MKIFRISGLIGFIVFTTLLLVVGFLFIDNWVKKGIEVSATNINGAEVNVASVDLTLSPLGFKIFDVQVTDKNTPTHNSLVIEEAVLDVNLAQLFLGRVRINDIRVQGIATNVERKRPGKLVEQNAEEPSALKEAGAALIESRKESLASAFPTPKEVVEESTAATKSAIANAEQSLTTSKSAVDTAVAKLPGDEEFAQYEEKIASLEAKKLDSLDALKIIQSEVKALGKQVGSDKLAIEQLKSEITKSVDSAKQAVNEIKAAPAEDWQTLLSNNPINKETALKVSKLLLGENVIGKFEQYQGYYETAQPWLARLNKMRSTEEEKPKQERLSGTYVRFPHPDPSPEFLIDQGAVSFKAAGWPWQMTMADVTGEQNITGKPTVFQIKRGEGENIAMQVDISLDRRDGVELDTVKLLGRGIKLTKQSTTITGSTLSWSPKPANLDGQIVINEGQAKGRITLAFRENEFTLTGDTKTDALIRTALSKVTQFDVYIDVSGPANKPKISISSTLDNQLGDAFSSTAKAEYDKWLATVRTELEAEVAKLRAPVDAELEKLKNIQQKAEQQAREFEQKVVQELARLEAKVESEIKRIEDEAKAAIQSELNAAKEKLDAEKARIEAEKKAAEAAAKKEAEDKAKAELDKLKGKIKF